MVRSLFLTIAILFACLLPSTSPDRQIMAANAQEGIQGREASQPMSASRAARAEKAIQDARRRQLEEREAALAAKEQELKKLEARLTSQIKALEESRKRLDDSVKVKKQLQGENQKKMVTFFKKMRPEQAGQLMDKLEEEKAIFLLNQMDTKTVSKLVPYLKQPRVVKWVTENLRSTP